jgi:Coenzyme PQQ synthesis protein D (PqqD)
MGKSATRQLPVARREGLLVETLPDEVLVYDLDRKKAHCLNQTAALIWQHCDGRRDVSEIALALSHHLNSPIDEEVVWYGLKSLSKSRLLEGEVVRPSHVPNVSRRDLIRKIGFAVSIPLVISVLAPEASAANSCVGRVCQGNPTICGAGCTCNGTTCI